MSPESLFNLGWALLGLIVAYAWWAAVRDSLFQMKLINISMELAIAYRSAGRPHDPSYQGAQMVLKGLVESAPYFNLPVMRSHLRRANRRFGEVRAVPTAGDPTISNWDQGITPWTEHAMQEMMVAVLIHLISRPSNLLIIASYLLSGRGAVLMAELFEFIRPLAAAGARPAGVNLAT